MPLADTLFRLYISLLYSLKSFKNCKLNIIWGLIPLCVYLKDADFLIKRFIYKLIIMHDVNKLFPTNELTKIIYKNKTRSRTGYEGAEEVQRYGSTFSLTSALDGRWLKTSPGRFTPGTQWIGGCVASIAGHLKQILVRGVNSFGRSVGPPFLVKNKCEFISCPYRKRLTAQLQFRDFYGVKHEKKIMVVE